MPLNYVSITGTFDDGSGSPLSGSAVFTPSETVYASGVPVASAANPVSFPITGGILTGARLLATDNSPLSFEGLTGFFYWSVVITLGGVSTASWSFFLPHTPSTVDLFTLANTAASGGGGATLPLTTLGDLLYENATPAAARLAGNTTAAKQFLTQTGTGSISAPPAWGAIQLADLPAGVGLQAWQFTPEQNGGKGDGKSVIDGAITSGTASLACATSTPFAAGDVGKTILVHGAGASGADLVTTILTFTDSGHVVLNANAGTTVSAKGVIWGTDNTTAIKSAMSAAVTYGQAHDQYAEIVFQPLIYVVGGAATVGGGTLGNAIFPLPVILPASNPKLTLVFKGLTSDVGALPHWLQPTIMTPPSCIAVLRLDGTNDGTNGPASTIGGPFNGYGGEPGLYTNLCVVVDHFGVLVPFNSTFGGFDFFGCAEAFVPDASVMAMAIVPAAGAWAQYNALSITNQWTFGLRMPAAGNNDRCDVGWFSAYGLTYGFMPSEHTTAVSIRCNYDIIGIEGHSGNGVSMVHGGRILRASVEACSQALGFFDGTVRLDIDSLDTENITNVVYDPSNHGQGTVQMRGTPGGGYGSAQNGATGMRLVSLDNASGPVASPQAPPASTVAWPNWYYRDADITLSVSQGSLTALNIDAVAQIIPTGCVLWKFTLPAGHSYTPTYTGTLTHTVTLL